MSDAAAAGERHAPWVARSVPHRSRRGRKTPILIAVKAWRETPEPGGTQE
jgi:hypothetical protein